MIFYGAHPTWVDVNANATDNSVKCKECMVLYFAVQQIRNETVGKVPFEVRLDAGSFYWGDHLRNPIVHKVRREE